MTIALLGEQDNDSWRSASAGKIELHLVTERPEFYRKAVRERGGDVPVLRLKGSPTAGISWYEAWDSGGDGTFALLAASMTLWHDAGPGARPFQVVRAEWDAMNDSRNAQPHWHVDVDVPMGILNRRRGQGAPPHGGGLLSAPTSGATGLEEITEKAYPAAPETVRISSYHLGMRGTWVGAPAERGWRNEINIVHLSQWVELCMNYLVSQYEQLGV